MSKGKEPDFLGLGGYASGAAACCLVPSATELPENTRNITDQSILWQTYHHLLTLAVPMKAQTSRGEPAGTAYAGVMLLPVHCSTLHTRHSSNTITAQSITRLTWCVYCSVDSAELRAAEAQAKLRDFGETSSKPNAALPSALDAFQEVCDMHKAPLQSSTCHQMCELSSCEYGWAHLFTTE